jgi:hypothetical protein
LLLNQYDHFSSLRDFILSKAKHSIHFALQTYLLVRAAKDSREPPKKKKVTPPSIIKWRLLCNHLLGEIQKAAATLHREYNGNGGKIKTTQARLTLVVTTSAVPEEHAEAAAAEIFHYPIQFMDNLVDISRFDDKYRERLC